MTWTRSGLATTGPTRGGAITGRRSLRDPVWRVVHPGIFCVGGVAGAAGQLAGWRSSPGPLRQRLPSAERRLVGRCRIVATAGAGPLGRTAHRRSGPGRGAFSTMLRVFRPHLDHEHGHLVPLCVRRLLCGLDAAAPVACAAALAASSLGRRRTRRGRHGLAALHVHRRPRRQQGGAHLAGHPQHATGAASGAAAAASLLELWPPGQEADEVVCCFALAGKGLEVVLTEMLFAEAKRAPRVALPLRHGVSGALWRAARALCLVGLAATALSHRGSRLRQTAGLLGYPRRAPPALRPHASRESLGARSHRQLRTATRRSPRRDRSHAEGPGGCFLRGAARGRNEKGGGCSQ